MEPAQIIALFNVLVSGAQNLAPTVAKLMRDGEVSAADQEALRERIDDLRALPGAHFSGPEWEL